VQAVQQLQEQTHKLSGELIDVQQQQHKRLSAIKKDIDDRMQARRVELWAADKALADLNAQLDLAQRKYNAAIDLNYAVDSKDVKEALAEIRDLSTKIEARKQTLGNDPIVTRVADALQDMINVTKERLEADRKRIEKDIKDQESAFAQSNMVEKLPDTQRAQAAALKAKQEAINGLRREYAAALDKRTTDSNTALRNLEAQVSTLNSQIDQRKRQLASDSTRKLTAEEEARRKTALAQKQAALMDAEDRAAVAREAYAKASRALTAAMSQTGDQTAARQKLEAIDQGWQQKEAEERQAQLSLEANKDQLKTLVTIGKPSESNIDVIASRDDRWLYSAGVAVALSVVFGAIAVFSVSGGDGRLRRPSEEDADGFDPDAEAGPLAIHEIGRNGRSANPRAANVPVEGV
jgi:DNA repair exonuclease SbcCD ATPase subunit